MVRACAVACEVRACVRASACLCVCQECGVCVGSTVLVCVSTPARPPTSRPPLTSPLETRSCFVTGFQEKLVRSTGTFLLLCKIVRARAVPCLFNHAVVF